MKNRTDMVLKAIDALSEVDGLEGRQKILLIDALSACSRLARALGAEFAEGYVASHVLNITKGSNGKKEK